MLLIPIISPSGGKGETDFRVVYIFIRIAFPISLFTGIFMLSKLVTVRDDRINTKKNRVIAEQGPLQLGYITSIFSVLILQLLLDTNNLAFFSVHIWLYIFSTLFVWHP